MSTRTGEIGTYLMRRERKREKEREEAWKEEAREGETSMGLRERAYYLWSRRKEIKRDIERIDEFKKKK